jgi:dynein heavy chain
MAEAQSDPRVQWVEDVVVPALKVKVERFRKLCSSEPDLLVLRDFLDSSERRAIYFSDGPKELGVYAAPPPSAKKKLVYLLKGEGGPLTAESVRSLLFGDIQPKPLEGLLQTCADVYLPLISNPANQKGWPDVVANEVTELFHRTVSAIYIAQGQSQGKTVLPLPPAQMLVADPSGYGSKDRIHVLETAVVTWTVQIKNVLKMDPEHVLAAGNPGPLVGLEFWAAKATNLESMMQQLHGDKIRKVMRVLNLTKSPYYDAFSMLIKEVDLACTEAMDNTKFLRTLKPSFEKLNSGDDFLELPALFTPIMHLSLLVWRDSKHFNSPAGLAVLLRQICNDLISRARAYVEPEEVFNIEASEAVERLVMTLKVCGHFKSCYFTYKLKSAKEIPQNPWKVQNSALFPRLDAFLERCMDLLDLFKTVTQFEKLERVEVGGNKGAHLTMCVSQIYADFASLYTGFKQVGYDVLDVEIARFDGDFYAFRQRIQELEARLANVLNDGFDDCASIVDVFKLTDSFGDLLERDFIQADLELRHLALIKAFGADLQDVRTLFVNERYRSAAGKFYQRDGAPLYLNMPPIAGALYWVRGLIERIDQPMEHLQRVMTLCADFDETRDVLSLHEEVLDQLRAFERSTYEEWAESVEDVSAEKLKMPLLIREHESAELAVNFDPALVRLLREVKYLHMLALKTPESAEALFAKHEVFRVQIGKLVQITQRYNAMVRTMLDVEKPLLKAQMKQIDKLVEKGLRDLTWSASGINDFVEQAGSLVSEAHATLGEMKANMLSIEKVLDEWAALPLMRRKEGKTYSPAAFVEEHEVYLESRYKAITESAKLIHKLLSNSNATLKVSKGAPSWRAYVEYVNDIVLNGLSRTVVHSLDYLLAQVDPSAAARAGGSKAAGGDFAPMLEVELLLANGDVRFSPALGLAPSREGILDRIHALIADFYECVRLVSRLERQDGDFCKEVEENEDVRFAVHCIISECEANEEQCNEFRRPFFEHRHLWVKDIETQLAKFVAASRRAGDAADADADADADAEAHSDALAELDLDKFDAQIAIYKAEQAEVELLTAGGSSRFVRINSKPVKNAIAVWVSKWVYAYTHFLEQRITASLDDLMSFVQKVQSGLNTEFDPEDTDQLISAMTYIRDVRRRTDEIDHMWIPLKGTVALLRKSGIAVPEATTELIESAPQRWENAKKATVHSREALGPLQALQAEKIKEEVEDFGERVEQFVAAFHAEAPFKFVAGVERAYGRLDDWNNKLREMEKEAALMAESEELFEVHVHVFKEMHECRAELGLLKQAWDFASLVSEIFADWRNTLWTGVDVDEMIEECKRLSREVKSLPKAVKAWDVAIGLQALVQDMAISLPLIQDLRDDSMRERHWKKLMRVCGKTFAMDAKFKLDHLLALKLHEFQDSVGEIVEQARQELKIDNQLQKIINAWLGLELQYEPFKQTGVYVLRPPDLVIEALDEHENSLQNMMGNRFMGFFEVSITEWKNKLAKVRSVLDIWSEVQRAWCSLESIFLGSEDIREQLPEDAKRFDTIDGDFREQMGGAKEIKSPIDACTADGREEAFIKCQTNLDLCQKSLAEYLEVKKKKFPRFYFVSPADLVDILSKGRNPPLIQEHFSKFTDNTAKIDWVPHEETGAPTSVARGMFSGEGEHVPYSEEFRCEGQVEEWLTGLMRHSQREIKQALYESVNAFMEVPRIEWLFKYCAQLSLTTSQIWWTLEVYSAFERLETGNDNALKDYLQVAIQGLATLTQLVATKLTWGDRMKMITMITIEVHARDIVQRLISNRVESSSDFAWQSQLKYRWDEERRDCVINICDAELTYSYEYTGNTGRLVITALTDRCYVTLTQALRLILGGAPAGPAGTGKTETTKDLGRGLAIWVIVQNCSDQMNNKVMANFFSGLAQTGAWGCFDEFNRIAVEVLSVVAGQYMSILEAIRSHKRQFLFEEEMINLVPTVGAFITMNPGYAGRTELPENLKALFRPCAMVVPDFENIAEISLAAEGFLEAKPLAHKFVTLFALCKELLSKQDHYDWGLRAMKGILRIAGGLKRSEPSKTEYQILMRALRDTNLPKFVLADFGIFLGLINDLFPKVDERAKTDPQLVQACKEVIAKPDSSLQPEELFITKICNLAEMLGVRHCCFVLGAAGAAKTKLWETLAQAQTHLHIGGGATICQALNPKAVTTNELYGYVHPVTKEPYDGIISKMMRDYSRMENEVPKWIILDGDIDAEWIESMNTVMDDNKVLTLVSNERIPLTSSMRLLFEISHLRNASPATVSRAGVIFLNESDIGWRPYVTTWVETMGDQKVATTLEQLFDQYVQPTLEHIRREKWQHVTPQMDFAMVQTLCKLLEGLLTKENAPHGSDKEVYETYFQYAAIWALGGGFNVEKGADMRKIFSDYWRSEFGKSALKFPEEGLVFDYFIDSETKKCAHWNEQIPVYTHSEATAFSEILVPTLDTTRLGFLCQMLAMDLSKPVMLVGGAGTAKTCLLSKLLREMPEDKAMYFNINFNSYTGAESLQPMLEAPLEKKTGSSFGPPGTRKLLYFIDDFNMPAPDKYGTQSAIELARQQIDYGGFYDLKKLTFKTIVNTMFVGAMNPTSGSFSIIDRMQRHFATFACPFPDNEVCRRIYGQILAGHLEAFPPGMQPIAAIVTEAAVALHATVADTFLPNAIKFHYQWNLRELSNIFQGLLQATPAVFHDQRSIARLWAHEAYRVYNDRLISDTDCARFEETLAKVVREKLGAVDREEVILAEPLIFASFAGDADDQVVGAIATTDDLSLVLNKKLHEYNESFARMDLVLFGDAMSHICRISRIINRPRGNALLIGVGGSGKQSLTRLATYISSYDIFQIKLTPTYGMADFREDLFNLYFRVGIKSAQVTFLFTDQHIFDERMMVYFNNLLSTGVIPDLHTEEDKDGLVNGVRSEVKAAGLLDSRDNCWDFFINKVRDNLHVVLCMSPVGDDFRVRCRKFPALCGCSAINYFHPWPREALVSVAERFLDDVEMESSAVRESCAQHMAFVHSSVSETAQRYKAAERRNVYTTPKSFLELIALYKSLLASNRATLDTLQLRLESGLVKLKESSTQVADMQVQLQDEKVIVDNKKVEVDALLVQVGQESNIAEEESGKAAIEAEKVAVIQSEVAEFKAQCEKDLQAAEPALERAADALNLLNKAALTELKSLTTPPSEVVNVTAAVAYMLAPPGTNLKKVDATWTGAKKMMSSVEGFLQQLLGFDKDNFDVAAKEYVRKYTGPADSPDPTFNYDYMKSKSFAAAGLCAWVVNICIYHDIFLEVAPKRQKLAEAETKLADANAKLQEVHAKVQELTDKCAALGQQLSAATDEKNGLIEKAERTAKRLNLAERLVNGLKDEGVRWGGGVESLKEQKLLLIGDILVAASFIAYIGPFNMVYRRDLIHGQWLPDVLAREIPMSAGLNPQKKLSDDATIALWNSEGLPSDELSIENGALITNCTRWPLIIDPQLQGVTWIKRKEEAHGLVSLQLSRKGYVDKLIKGVEEGAPILIENIGETIDAVLEPVIARGFISKGRRLVLKLGDKEVDVACAKDAEGKPLDAPLFRLYIQTKLPNPRYIPEIQAQTTLINFTVTEAGLEDQLLAVVVNKERPDLEMQRLDLVEQQNQFTIKLKELEDDLLQRLATAEGDILGDEELILSLENTKITVTEINEKVLQAKTTAVEIGRAREAYRPTAARGSLVYFLINHLNVIDHMYQYSLGAFNYVFSKALEKANGAEALAERCDNLLDSVTYTCFSFVTRGLFEKHRLIFSTMLAIKTLQAKSELSAEDVDYLIKTPKVFDKENPLGAWLPDSSWYAVLALSQLEAFHTLPQDLEGSWKRWKEWCEHEQPEMMPLPQEWKRLPAFQILQVVRVLRPDRTSQAVSVWVRTTLSARYTDAIPFNLETSFEDSGPAVPIFFLLSPGVDPVVSVKALGARLGKTEEENLFVGVSLGQGQEPVAEKALDRMYVEGGWVMLQNIELVARWLPKLEKKLEALAEGAHPDFRVFLSALPQQVVPVPILQNSIKLTNEPPSGLKANMLRAYMLFDNTIWDNSSKQTELKAIVFALCFFHSVVCERRKFGAIGWNRAYPFNEGDLTVCIKVASNYLENNAKVPWDDVRYIFGEIMYGGHITDNWDRRLCMTYLSVYLKEDLLEGQTLFPGFATPPSMTHKQYMEYVEEGLEREVRSDLRTTQRASFPRRANGRASPPNSSHKRSGPCSRMADPPLPGARRCRSRTGCTPTRRSTL